jgi:hypothetical protein
MALLSTNIAAFCLEAGRGCNIGDKESRILYVYGGVIMMMMRGI